MKRLIADNIGARGTLQTDAFTLAILNYRNTPDRDSGLSPAQILFARKLRDALPCHPSNLVVRKEWVMTRDAREEVMAKRHLIRRKELAEHTRAL